MPPTNRIKSYLREPLPAWQVDAMANEARRLADENFTEGFNAGEGFGYRQGYSQAMLHASLFALGLTVAAAVWRAL